jgi:hypothetical protein
MNFEKILINALAVIIGIPVVIVGGCFIGLTLPVVLLGGAAARAWRDAPHELTVIEDNGSDVLLRCTCGEVFTSDACGEENVRWNTVKNCNESRCPRDV